MSELEKECEVCRNIGIEVELTGWEYCARARQLEWPISRVNVTDILKVADYVQFEVSSVARNCPSSSEFHCSERGESSIRRQSTASD
jgi:hypothetical protein